MSVRRVPRRVKRMRLTPVGVAVPTAGFANANVGFPDGLAHQAGHQDRILDGGCIQNLFSWLLLPILFDLFVVLSIEPKHH
jgi:hypothetical protein